MKMIPLFLTLFALTLSAEPQFIEMSQIHPGQSRYASASVDDKIVRFVKRSYTHQDPESGEWAIQYDEGKCVLGEDWVLPVVKGPFGYVLVDGHHSYLGCQKLGATTIRIRVIADLSDLEEGPFWDEMESRGWAYLTSQDGGRVTPPHTFDQLQDDPNRHFAAQLARKVHAKGSRGAEYPVWIKLGDGEPFVEFRIADALRARGVVYDYGMGPKPPPELVEAARKALVDADIERIWVVPERTHYQDLACCQQPISDS